MSTIASSQQATEVLSAVKVPDTQLTREIAEFIRDTETELLFNP